MQASTYNTHTHTHSHSRSVKMKNDEYDHLYDEIPKFIDKKTLLEFMSTVEKNNDNIARDLKKLYRTKLRPLEEVTSFKDFDGRPPIEESYITAKPMILLIGQYSSGKSTFVKYLINKDYPGIRIGPEPTTDKFVAVMHSTANSNIPGNALVLDGTRQFKPLLQFGGKFLNRFEAALVDSPILRALTIIDTPGILSDNHNSEGYDYKRVIEWFAAQADRIFLFVDAHKLELSGDFQLILHMIRVHDDKLRIVLNKVDLVNEQELIRIYGALMWFLGQTLTIKEVIQIYIGCFANRPINNHSNRKLFEHEEFKIFQDLCNLAKESLLRKVNCIAKRARHVSIHASIVQQLRDLYNRQNLKRFFFRSRTKRNVINNLDRIYKQLANDHNLSPNDLPELKAMKLRLYKCDFNKICPPKKLWNEKEALLNEDIPLVIFRINKEKFQESFELNENSPFYYEKGEGFDEGSLDDQKEWIVARYLQQFQPLFDQLKSNDNKVTASKAKAHMLQSNLTAKVLNKIWKLADVDQDGMLDEEEFALAMYLVMIKLKDFEVPNQLPRHLCPPGKRAKSL